MTRRLIMFTLGFLVGLFIGFAIGCRQVSDLTRATQTLLVNILRTLPK